MVDLGIPFSQDMGSSYWLDCMSSPDPAGGFYCNPAPRDPFQPVPVPLLANYTVIAQPAGLYTIAKRYTTAAIEFITTSADADKDFFLYFPFNHVHAPDSCGEDFCGKSLRGPIGDAVEEMDWVVGKVLNTLRSLPGVANNSIVWFTSDNGSPKRPDGNLPLRG